MGLSRHLGGLFLVPFVVACGTEPRHHSIRPRCRKSRTGMAVAYLVEIGQSVAAVAHVTGPDKPVTWALRCDTGQASMVPTGNSATVTALAGGNCLLTASEGMLSIVAIVRVPPLTPGDSCTDDSQCGPGAPVCGAGGGCGGACTTLCTTDADAQPPIRPATTWPA